MWKTGKPKKTQDSRLTSQPVARLPLLGGVSETSYVRESRYAGHVDRRRVAETPM